MTIEQIRYFITVAKCLSYTKASEQLFVSQPALSRYIRNMEEELNIQLFIRTGSGIRLTPAGSELCAGLGEIYNHYTSLLAKAERVQRGIAGELQIGVLDETDIADFVPIVNRYFIEKHPNVELRFRTGSFSSLTSELYSGALDMIFTIRFQVENKESILFQHVTHSKDHIVMAASNPLARKKKVTMADVKEERFVMISKEDNPESSGYVFELCREFGYVPKVTYAKTLAEQALLVQAGVGITILDSRTRLRHNPNMKFFEIESHWDPSLVIAWHRNNYNPLISVFLDKLNEVMHLEHEDVYGINN